MEREENKFNIGYGKICGAFMKHRDTHGDEIPSHSEFKEIVKQLLIDYHTDQGGDDPEIFAGIQGFLDDHCEGSWKQCNPNSMALNCSYFRVPDNWLFVGHGDEFMKNIRVDFPELLFGVSGGELTPEQKILLAKYQIVVEQLIKEHKPRKRNMGATEPWYGEGKDGIFTHFYDFIYKYKEELKTRVQNLNLLEQPSLPAPVAAAPVASTEEDWLFGGAIKKNKHRTSRNRRKIRKSKSKRNKSKRNKSKRSKSKRKRTKRKRL